MHVALSRIIKIMNTVYDVAVFGAGVSGICAALQCARLGKRTLLVEKGALPGGAITLNRIELPAIFAVNGKQIIRGIGWELISKTYQAMQQVLLLKRLEQMHLRVVVHWQHSP